VGWVMETNDVDAVFVKLPDAQLHLGTVAVEA
jgi:hypothetical protein